MKNKKGFTLVELMAVIIIISLIALLTFPSIINQIKKTKKSTNKMVEDILITQAKKYVSDNKDEFEEDEYCMSISTLLARDYIKEDLVSINKIKDNKVIHINRSTTDSYEILDKDKCVITPTAVKYLLKKTNLKSITTYTDGNKHEMYTFDHEATEQTPALTDYRYIGSDPYNYVEFNNELWRIIGVFDTDYGTGKYEKRIKLIRGDSLGNMPWNSSSVNEWVGSTMQVYLNDIYTLDNASKEMVLHSKYYLGGRLGNTVNGETFYVSERSENTYSGRNKNWVGNVALMYPSDYIFTYALGVNDICYNTPGNCDKEIASNGWLYSGNVQWTLTPNSSNTSGGFYILLGGAVSFGNSNANASRGSSPVVYLKSNVKITSGDGTQSNPYQLSM